MNRLLSLVIKDIKRKSSTQPVIQEKTFLFLSRIRTGIIAIKR